MSSPTGDDGGLERKLLTAEAKIRQIQESAQKMAHKLKTTERECRQKGERLEKMRYRATKQNCDLHAVMQNTKHEKKELEHQLVEADSASAADFIEQEGQALRYKAMIHSLRDELNQSQMENMSLSDALKQSSSWPNSPITPQLVEFGRAGSLLSLQQQEALSAQDALQAAEREHEIQRLKQEMAQHKSTIRELVEESQVQQVEILELRESARASRESSRAPTPSRERPCVPGEPSGFMTVSSLEQSCTSRDTSPFRGLSSCSPLRARPQAIRILPSAATTAEQQASSAGIEATEATEDSTGSVMKSVKLQQQLSALEEAVQLTPVGLGELNVQELSTTMTSPAANELSMTLTSSERELENKLDDRLTAAKEQVALVQAAVDEAHRASLSDTTQLHQLSPCRAELSERLLEMTRTDLDAVDLELRESKVSASASKMLLEQSQLEVNRVRAKECKLHRELSTTVQQLETVQSLHISAMASKKETDLSCSLLSAKLLEHQAVVEAERAKATSVKLKLRGVHGELVEALGANCQLMQRAARSEELVASLALKMQKIKEGIKSKTLKQQAIQETAQLQGKAIQETAGSSVRGMLMLYAIISILAYIIAS